MLHQLAEAAAAINVFPDGLREVVTAGEALQITPAVRRFFERLPNCSLHNHYGPSETHVVTAHKLSGPPATWPALPPIGMPLPGCTVHIVDGAFKPIVDGEPGELLLGGVCLARGYVNRPELTAERFFQFGENLERVYRTGDLARRLADGTLEFLGRADDQVKIRGYRIELGEIEAALRSHPEVKSAAVAAHEAMPGERYLVGYIVPHASMLTADDLRRFLAERLPDYMVPGQFVQLDQLPLTPSGKVDRRSLPAP